MAENKSTGLPSFNSTQEIVDFFDNNDMGEFWEEMPEVDFSQFILPSNFLRLTGGN